MWQCLVLQLLVVKWKSSFKLVVINVSDAVELMSKRTTAVHFEPAVDMRWYLQFVFLFLL